MLIQPEIDFCNIPASEFIPAHRVCTYSWGDANALETVFCVHGLSRNGRDFDFLAEQLSKYYRVISLDMSGRGKSDYLGNTAAYNYATYLAVTGYVLASYKLAKVHWLGTSMGGIVGMMMANSFPSVLASLTLNDIGTLIPAAGLKRILAYVGVNNVFDDRAAAENALRINCKSFGINDEVHWRHVFTHGVIERDGKFHLAYDAQIAASFPKENSEDTNMWAMWEAVTKIPTLLIRGELSDILTYETAAQMKEKHPTLTYNQITGVGHAPALMNVEQINLIQNWLKSV